MPLLCGHVAGRIHEERGEMEVSHSVSLAYEESQLTYDKKSGHVAQDILPYMCVYEDCSTPEEMYLTSDDLLKHVQDQHSILQWVCSPCA